MKYCRRCILPDTRPNIRLDEEGVCSACRGHDDKLFRIDWAARARAFDDIVAAARARGCDYDCIVPVSGGKDSWRQVIRCREFGLKTLAVTWRTPARTEIGRRNLDNLIGRLGVDHIDYTIDPDVERRFMVAAFEQKGATGLPMHMALFAVPIRLGVRLRIPLIVWGENPQLEFGGPEADRLATNLDRNWIARYGVTNGTGPRDWTGPTLSERDLAAYRLPDDDEFDRFPVRSIFLGSFFPWDSFENAQIAAAHGFESDESHRKTGTWSFADIDCEFISLHHYLKWHKFGFLRSFDNLSVEVRYGRMTREEAVATVRRLGVDTPTADIESFCRFAGKPIAWFHETAERFRNPEIWRFENGRWRIPGFLIEDGWNW